jgi:AcrR family transcriptional regulator
MPAISPEKMEARKDAIIDAAEASIAEIGLGELSARAVAKRAGCSTSLIYLHFEDFDEVILRANSRFIAKLDAALAEASAANEGIADKYVALAKTYLHVGLRYRRQWAALFEHRMADGRPLPEWHLAEHLNMFRHVAEPLAFLNEGMDDEERWSLARTIYSSVHGVVSLSIEKRLGQVPTEKLEVQLELFVRSLVRGLEVTLAAR